MNINKTIQSITFFALTIFLISSNNNLLASNSCKGTIEEICQKQNDCRWVGSYKRKDGASVKGYCRAITKKAPILEENIIKEKLQKAQTKPSNIKNN